MRPKTGSSLLWILKLCWKLTKLWQHQKQQNHLLTLLPKFDKFKLIRTVTWEDLLDEKRPEVTCKSSKTKKYFQSNWFLQKLDFQHPKSTLFYLFRIIIRQQVKNVLFVWLLGLVSTLDHFILNHSNLNGVIVNGP